MRTKVTYLEKRRRYSEQFKRHMVERYESGKFSVSQLASLHGLDRSMIYRWIHRFSNFNDNGARIVEMKDSTNKKVNDLQQRVKELERMLGQKQIKIEYLEKMIDIAKDELKIDIKKNFDTPPSPGSGKTRKK